jgi:hypothetical protein
MIKNILNVAPLLADHFIDTKIDTKAFEENGKLVKENAHRLGLYYKYLGCLQDSWFIGTQITANKLTIKLNDFTTHVFSDVIVDKKKLDIAHEKRVFPILLEFETTNLTFNTVDENGEIRSIRSTPIGEYLFEQIISIDNEKIEIGLVVWKDGVGKKRGHYILILISAKNINLTELQDEAWQEIFGNAYDDYYKYFKDQLATGRYLSDQSVCYDLYDEYQQQTSTHK